VIPIVCTIPDLHEKADTLAVQMNSVRVGEAPKAALYFLVLSEEGLALHAPSLGFSPLRVDFLEGPMKHRRLYGGGRQQLFAKSIGVKADKKPMVLDATAGMGRDAFVLASLGCDVTLLERHPVISALLEDALKRARESESLVDIMARMHFYSTDAFTYLEKTLTELPDVLYLDPMFPFRRKSALVKKEMRIFKSLVGNDEDALSLLEKGLALGIPRIVVKRPRLSPNLTSRKPTLVMSGKSTRFDVYL
jgi:16S rRNA (guanine1516-N2)-methyltransferase